MSFFGDHVGTICKIVLKSGVNLYKKRVFLGVVAPLTPSFGCSNHFAPAKNPISCILRYKQTQDMGFLFERRITLWGKLWGKMWGNFSFGQTS